MKEIILNIEGMTCQGCMNTVKMHINNIIEYGEVELELVPGSADIICDDDVDFRDIIDEINHNTNYHASFVEENEVEDYV